MPTKALASPFAYAPPHLGHAHLEPEGVAGNHRSPEPHVVGPGEQNQLAAGLRLREYRHGSGLSHGFELKHAGKDGVPGEVATEDIVAGKKVFLRDGVFAGNELNHPVKPQKGLPVRHYRFDLVSIQHFSLTPRKALSITPRVLVFSRMTLAFSRNRLPALA